MAKKKNNKKNTLNMAQLADKHHLYELSVQCSEAEVDFVDATYQKLRKRKAKLLREDFCGTANVCCEWVKRGNQRQAIGVDLDPDVLQWGKENNLAQLSKHQRERITLINQDVISVNTQAPDIISAMNFSYWLLKERAVLKKYLVSVHKALAKDGILFMDAYGGYDSHREIEEPREIEDGADGFTYIWDQTDFNPIDHTLECHIHFAFPDGSEMREAFKYVWRFYSLPEIRDLLVEVGFKRITVYWQGWDEDGEPDGDFNPALRADADAGWIAYISAEK